MLAHLIRYLDRQKFYTLLGILAAMWTIIRCRAWNMLPPLLGTIGLAMLHKLLRAGTWAISSIITGRILWKVSWHFQMQGQGE